MDPELDAGALAERLGAERARDLLRILELPDAPRGVATELFQTHDGAEVGEILAQVEQDLTGGRGSG